MNKLQRIVGSVRITRPLMIEGDYGSQEVQVDAVCHWSYHRPNFNPPRYGIDDGRVHPEFWEPSYRIFVRQADNWVLYNGGDQLRHIVSVLYDASVEAVQRSIARRWRNSPMYIPPKFEFDGSRGTHRT